MFPMTEKSSLAIRAEKAKTPKPFDFKPFQPFHCQLCVSRQTVSTCFVIGKLSYVFIDFIS